MFEKNIMHRVRLDLIKKVSARGVKGREENPLCDIREPAKTRAKTNFVQGVMGAWMGVMVLSLNSLGNLCVKFVS
jgi:hypothetical protein